jgi:isopenicillin N synthase-like dioxygenase
MSSQFFTLPREVKMKYQRLSDTGNNGYVSLEQERCVLSYIYCIAGKFCGN